MWTPMIFHHHRRLAILSSVKRYKTGAFVDDVDDRDGKSVDEKVHSGKCVTANASGTTSGHDVIHNIAKKLVTKSTYKHHDESMFEGSSAGPTEEEVSVSYLLAAALYLTALLVIFCVVSSSFSLCDGGDISANSIKQKTQSSKVSDVFGDNVRLIYPLKHRSKFNFLFAACHVVGHHPNSEEESLSWNAMVIEEVWL